MSYDHLRNCRRKKHSLDLKGFPTSIKMWTQTLEPIDRKIKEKNDLGLNGKKKRQVKKSQGRGRITQYNICLACAGHWVRVIAGVGGREGKRGGEGTGGKGRGGEERF